MKVIPVIDVLNGIAVHGIRGERKLYQPLKSILFKSVSPLKIASLLEKLGFTILYLADLDAILRKSTNFKIYKQISTKTGLDLMVDAAVADITTAYKVMETDVQKIIIGSETLSNLDFVRRAVEVFGGDKIVVSIDQKRERILSSSKYISSMNVFSFIEQLEDFGVNKIIILDLDRVGTEHGINLSVLEKIRERTEIDLIVGGGIQNLQELELLRNFGFFGALVATVLHNGKVTIDNLKTTHLL
jgi:phosphoribosylformimino-5-aminoimidazole carboxamide ribotide isomerase